MDDAYCVCCDEKLFWGSVHVMGGVVVSVVVEVGEVWGGEVNFSKM